MDKPYINKFPMYGYIYIYKCTSIYTHTDADGQMRGAPKSRHGLLSCFQNLDAIVFLAHQTKTDLLLVPVLTVTVPVLAVVPCFLEETQPSGPQGWGAARVWRGVATQEKRRNFLQKWCANWSEKFVQKRRLCSWFGPICMHVSRFSFLLQNPRTRISEGFMMGSLKGF